MRGSASIPCRSCFRRWALEKAGPSTLSRQAVKRYFSATPATSSSSSSSKPLKIAIIGSGPSGFYTASRILNTLPLDSPNGRNVQVHMYERLPTPYGLVRYGVAPDHPEVKNCQHKFDELSSDPRFKYLGNVSVGTQPSSTPDTPHPLTTLSPYTYPHALHLPLSSLLPYYTTLILTYGASLSNPLNSVPGSSSSPAPLAGVIPALALVGWYNGHPAFSHLTPHVLSALGSSQAEDVAIIGQGNVALDVARILLKPVDTLRQTDLPESVLDVLAQSTVKRVSVVGRRGPGQVAFTIKEFREMLKIGASYQGLESSLAEETKAMVEMDRPKKRLFDLMEKGNGEDNGDKEFKLDFLKSPKAFLPDPSSTSSSIVSGQGESCEVIPRVGEVEWNINELLAPPSTPDPPSSQVPSLPKASDVIARPTGEVVRTKAGIVIESVGYRSEPLGVGEEIVLPFDKSRGRLQNIGGRLTDDQGLAVSGAYAAGWAARGPVGVIASTMHDAYSLSGLVLDDHFANPSQPVSTSFLNPNPEEGLPPEVEKGLKDGVVVDLSRWQKIDEAEIERVKGTGKEREKFTAVKEMLEVI